MFVGESFQTLDPRKFDWMINLDLMKILFDIFRLLQKKVCEHTEIFLLDCPRTL